MKPIREFYAERLAPCLKPPPTLTVSEWADKYRMLSSESSAEPGHWKTDRAPYQREIMDAVTQPDIEKVVVMSSSQVGKSEILNNIVGYYIDMDPCPMLLIEPTDMMAEDYSKRRIAPLIRDTDCLAEKVSDSKTRDVNNTILMKAFPGGFLGMGGANSPAGLASRPIRVLLCDEVDRYPDSAGSEGDPVMLAEKRTITFWNRKKVFVSSPGIKGVSRIEDEYLSGTQERWCVKCPHCGEYVYFDLYGMIYNYEKDEKGNYHVGEITFRCPACNNEADEIAWKHQPGRWIAENPQVKRVRSFRLNAFSSPWYSWELIIVDYLRTKDDPEQYRVFVNTVLGEPFEIKGEIENESFLIERREDYGAELPDGVLFLTAAVDTQDSWLEYDVVGWGKGEESWAIRHGLVPGCPDQPEPWEQLDDILKKSYSFRDGITLNIGCTCIDSGGHYTSQVYAYCKKNEGYRIFAIKGQGGSGIPLINRIIRTKKENAVLILLGVDEGKTSVVNGLKIKEPGPFYCHFPKNTDYDTQYFKGLISERLVPHKKNGMMVLAWEKVSPDIRNEPFDLRNYARAALKIANPAFDKFEDYLRKSRGQEVKSNAVPHKVVVTQPRIIRNNFI